MSILADRIAIDYATGRGLSTKEVRGLFRHVGPNWYATVMGTAIVANAAASLPLFASSWLRVAATVAWGCSVLLLILVAAARAGHLIWHRNQARAHLLDPAMAPFYGCAAMALLSVGAGTMLVGKNVVGESVALAAYATLWSAGTFLGLVVAVGILVLMITKYDLPVGSAAPTWLLAVVAPMVSAATGALLVPHLPAGQARGTMLLACYSLFGISLIATMVILPSVFAKLVHHKIGPIQTTPALWLVLGPLGQSVTAVNQLADASQGAVRGEYHRALEMFALIYGVPVLGFALLWLAIAACITLRAFRRRMPFALTWWAFTFPVGTCVTGAAGLAKHTGLNAYAWVATGLFLLLVSAWAMVVTRTGHGVLKGDLLPRQIRTA